MTRRNMVLLAIGAAIVCLCVGLVAHRFIWRRPAPAPTVVSTQREASEGEAPPTTGPISTIIDLPGDPVLVRRGVTAAPRSFRVVLPITLAANAPKVESTAFFVNTQLASSNGGFMGKFLEAAPGADVADPEVANAGTQLVVDASDAAAAGFDDDGGASTPDSPQLSMVTDLNSSQLGVSIGGSNAKPQIREAIIRVVVLEKISDLLIRNGFAEDGAREVETAAKALYNIQSLPPSSVAVAEGALDTSGAYRVTQLAIYENKEYVGAVALAEAGGYGVGAQPALPPGLLEEGPKDVDLAVHYNLSDGVYSAGVRNNVPEPVIREAIQLLGKLTDLTVPLQPEENVRALYARDFRGKSKSSGKVIYVGLSGPSGQADCYSFQSSDGVFRCFDPKGGGVPTPPINNGAPTPPINGGGGPSASLGRIFAPIRGAPVTSLFGMRFHPILHILRLHAGIDFGAPVGSPVRAVADGKVEIAGPVSGFGNHVRLQHKGFETSYSHLSEISAGVAVGATVAQGQVIALSGNTGLSTGPHLHFEYYLDRVAVDPMPHMGIEVAGAGGAVAAVPIGAAPPSEQEIAAFATQKAIVDAALQTASN
ncbi:MAG TPA: M23 family metallopeptidase [Roseiarcus sp.]|jgi:murein DD-endopeptidase MepM/ murein hydrolase activator NlpD